MATVIEEPRGEHERLPLGGKVVIQGLVFGWVCPSAATLKVHHPEYGVRIVDCGRHYQPSVLAQLIALDMVGFGTGLRVGERNPTSVAPSE